jgi:hypothetical protein
MKGLYSLSLSFAVSIIRCLYYSLSLLFAVAIIRCRYHSLSLLFAVPIIRCPYYSLPLLFAAPIIRRLYIGQLPSALGPSRVFHVLAYGYLSKTLLHL